LKLLDGQFSESIFLAETQADDPSGASRKFEHRMTKDRIKAVVGFVTAEFSPLIGFLVLSWTFGLKVAIAGTLAIVVVDTSWRLWKRVPFTRTYILFVVLTVGFGIIDLPVGRAVHAQIRSRYHQHRHGWSFRPRRRRAEAADPGSGGATRGKAIFQRCRPNLFSLVHAGMGGLFRPQGGVLPLDGLDATDGGSTRGARAGWLPLSRPDAVAELYPGTPGLFSMPALGMVASYAVYGRGTRQLA
jgi:hypothetical protein